MRRIEWTEDLAQRLASELCLGLTCKAACAEVGVGYSTLRARLRDIPGDAFARIVRPALQRPGKPGPKPSNGAKPPPAGEPASHTESRPGVLEVEELARSTARAATLERAVLELSERVRTLEARPAVAPADVDLPPAVASVKADLRALQERVVGLEAKVIDSQEELGRLREMAESRLATGEAAAKTVEELRNSTSYALARLAGRANALEEAPTKAGALTRIRAHLEALSYVVATVPVDGVLRLLEHVVDEEVEASE